MPSLADLFNPSFLMFLGILVLVAALLVVYIESKNREQNHKIQSMFSIVSSLAEEVHNLKLGLSQFSFSGGNNDFNPNNSQNFDEDNNLDKPNKPNILNNISLIPVSDDEDNSDSESEESEELDLESVDSYSSSEVLNINDLDEDDKSINLDKNKIKILKINMSENFENENSSHDNLEIDEIDEMDELDELSESESVSSNSNEGVEHLLLLKKIHENENENENLENSLENINSNILDISSSELKTINISLEDSNNENIDYKKLSLPKLRSIVVEKGLTSDSSKLKKNELLKLLGIE